VVVGGWKRDRAMIGFLTLGELGGLGAKAVWAGEESRAKDAKDAKV